MINCSACQRAFRKRFRFCPYCGEANPIADQLPPDAPAVATELHPAMVVDDDEDDDAPRWRWTLEELSGLVFIGCFAANMFIGIAHRIRHPVLLALAVVSAPSLIATALGAFDWESKWKRGAAWLLVQSLSVGGYFLALHLFGARAG